MTRHAHATALTLSLALALGLFLTSPGSADDESYPKVKAEVAKIAKMKPDAAKEEAAKVAKDAFLEDVMRVFKHRRYKGFGVGPEGRTDGIEYKIILIATGREKLNDAAVKAQSKDLVQMTKEVRAVSDLLPHYAPKKQSDKDKWNKLAKEMNKNVTAAGEAAAKGNAAAFTKAIVNLDANCKDCHSAFRD
jgi:hypothetical protein